MDFAYSDEQKLLADSVGRFVRERYEFAAWRKLVTSETGFSRQHWRQMADLGWLGVALPESEGGLGGGPVETMIIMQAFGRGLVVEPYLSTIVLGGNLIRLAGTAAQRRDLLPRLAGGELLLAFAAAEAQARYDLANVTTTAKSTRAGFVLNGAKCVVADAPSADKLLVLARTSGKPRAVQGLTLFLVDRAAKGVHLREYRTIDNRRAADIAFERVAVAKPAVIGKIGAAYAAVEAAVEHAIAALGAEAVGAMQVLYETTLAYVKTRKQFGRPIGEFQVLQHRMVDMLLHVEQAKSMAMAASLKLSAPAGDRAKTIAAAKVQIGRSGRFVGSQAVQLHGGMGVTDELNVGHYMKRLMAIDTHFGNADHHLKRFASL